LVIGIRTRLKSLLAVYNIIPRLPSVRKSIGIFLNPIDSTRVIEFSYLLRFIELSGIKPKIILDVSSPYILAYLLSKIGKVVKTDINIEEKKNILESENLFFMPGNATNLPFENNSFDLVYSISVIEHIYGNYFNAVREMVRVTRPKGHIYLTFPVSSVRTEEWLDKNIYGHQHKENGRFFFQYRFNESDLHHICCCAENVEILARSIYWEKKRGRYDKYILLMRKEYRNKKINFMKNIIVNNWASFSLLEAHPRGFETQRNFGNACVILKKLR